RIWRQVLPLGFQSGVDAGVADVVQFVGHRVLELRPVQARVKIEKDGGVAADFENEAVGLRLDDGEYFGVDDGVAGQVGQGARSRLAQVGLLPLRKSFLQRRCAARQVVGEHELLEVGVGKVAV